MRADVPSVFGKIYRDNEWTNGSGPGSFRSFNRELLDYLTTFLSRPDISSIGDIGCGDFQLFKQFDFGKCQYTGFDVVSKVIEKNRNQVGNKNAQFAVMPERLDSLPHRDLYLIKDVLIHLPNEDSAEILRNVLHKCKYAVVVNNVADDGDNYNGDIVAGSFRPVDVSKAPFDLPVIETIRYGRAWDYDPRLPRLIARLLRKRVWPGAKHIQLLAGSE